MAGRKHVDCSQKTCKLNAEEEDNNGELEQLVRNLRSHSRHEFLTEMIDRSENLCIVIRNHDNVAENIMSYLDWVGDWIKRNVGIEVGIMAVVILLVICIAKIK